MNTLAPNLRVQRKINFGYIARMCVLFTVLILIRSIIDFGFYLFACISLSVFLASNSPICIALLFFLLPFSTILKYSFSGMSWFTILFFLTIVKMVLECKKIDARLVAALLILVAYCILFSGIEKLTTIITMFFGILMLYYVRFNRKTDVVVIVVAYSFGIILASILALNKESFPLISGFVRNSMLKLSDEQYTSRFGGLYGNPNYYTMDVTMALSAIIVLLRYRRISSKLLIACFLALSTFGLMSVSKSFLIVWLALIAVWCVSSLKQGLGKFVSLALILGIGAFLAYYLAKDSIDALLSRLAEDGAGSLDQIVTGRFGIWISYLKTIFGNNKILFFGNGLDTIITEIRKGAHNTYLEALFMLGIFGLTLFMTAIVFAIGKIRIKGIFVVPFFALMVRMLTIGIFTYDNLWFYLAIPLMLAYDYQYGLMQRRAILSN